MRNIIGGTWILVRSFMILAGIFLALFGLVYLGMPVITGSDIR